MTSCIDTTGRVIAFFWGEGQKGDALRREASMIGHSVMDVDWVTTDASQVTSIADDGRHVVDALHWFERSVFCVRKVFEELIARRKFVAASFALEWIFDRRWSLRLLFLWLFRTPTLLALGALF